mgnify:CR=1 FL=1
MWPQRSLTNTTMLRVRVRVQVAKVANLTAKIARMTAKKMATVVKMRAEKRGRPTLRLSSTRTSSSTSPLRMGAHRLAAATCRAEPRCAPLSRVVER